MMRPLFCILTVLVLLSRAVTAAQAYEPEVFEQDMLAIDALYLEGDLPGAESKARAVYEQARKELGPAKVMTLRVGRSLNNMISQQGRLDESFDFLMELDRLAKLEYLPQHPMALIISMDYAIALSNRNSHSKALPLMAEAVATAEYILGPDDDTTLRWQFHLAALYARMGFTVEALETFGNVYAKLSAKAGPDNIVLRSEVLLQTARVKTENDDPAGSIADFETAIALMTEFWGPNHPTTITALTEYADALWSAQQRDALPEIIVRAKKATLATYGESSLAMAKIEELNALVLTAGGPSNSTFDQGLAAQRRAIEIYERELSPEAGTLGQALLNYAPMIWDVGDVAAALDAALRAEKAQFGSRDTLFGLIFDAAAQGILTDKNAGKEFLRLVQVGFTSEAGAAAKALGIRLSLGDGQDAQELRIVTDMYDKQTRLSSDLLTLVSIPLAKRDTGAEFQLRADLSETEAAISDYSKALFERRPELNALTQDTALSLEELQSLLGPQEALIILDIGRDEGDLHLALAVTDTDIAFANLNWTTSSFANAVSDVRKGISLRLGVRAAAALDDSATSPDQGFDFYAAHWLYSETIGKVDAILKDKTHLYIDARGVLGSIPPHLLIVKDDPLASEMSADWLIRHAAITVLPSVYSLKLAGLSRRTAPAKAPLLGFADPSYADTGNALPQGADVLRGALTPLPETAYELAQVALAVGADLTAQRTGKAATEAGLKATDLSEYGILYFATHGLVSGDAVGNAVLGEPALALTAGQGEDGLLTATEIAQLKLNADWVVLSACNTAVGDAPGGQALSGLARAFTYAGARSLLVSHWPVESQSAVSLMTDIFERRAANPDLNAAEAQRQAMLAMIDTPQKPQWPHPAYWAPFVLVGDPD
jgi:CHAT domain-containing protein